MTQNTRYNILRSSVIGHRVIIRSFVPNKPYHTRDSRVFLLFACSCVVFRRSRSIAHVFHCSRKHRWACMMYSSAHTISAVSYTDIARARAVRIYVGQHAALTRQTGYSCCSYAANTAASCTAHSASKAPIALKQPTHGVDLMIHRTAAVHVLIVCLHELKRPTAFEKKIGCLDMTTAVRTPILHRFA